MRLMSRWGSVFFFFEGGCLGVDAYVDGWMEEKMFLWFRECVCILWRESWVEILFPLRTGEGCWLEGRQSASIHTLLVFGPPSSLYCALSRNHHYHHHRCRCRRPSASTILSILHVSTTPWVCRQVPGGLLLLRRTTIAFVFSNTQVGEMHVSTKLDCQLASHYRSNFESSTLRSIRFVFQIWQLIHLPISITKFISAKHPDLFRPFIRVTLAA